MSELTELSNEELLYHLLMGALRVGDERLNAVATELFGRSDGEGLRELVLQAVNRKNSEKHRLRLLRVIERIWHRSDPNNYLDLGVLLQDRSPAIRAAAARILFSIAPDHRPCRAG